MPNASTGQLTLEWDPNTETDLSGYRLYYGTTSGAYQSSIDVGNITTYTVTGLQNAQVYYFAVTAYNTAGAESAYSSEVSATTGGTTDTTPPAVSVSSPPGGSTVSGTTTITASASDDVGVAGVQFLLDGSSLGAEDVAAPYSLAWDTLSASNGAHTLAAVARDAAGNTTTSAAISVTVTNDTTGPAISAVAAGSITPTGATISWTTNEASDSQVEYGPTTAYGSTTPLNGSLVTAHSVPLSGLTGTTLYHYRVKSRDSAGNLATSGDATFTTKDGTAPAVSITAPASGATLSGTVTVTATASDNVGIAGVQFLLDGSALGAEDVTAPYSVSWDTTTAANGSHTLSARARDAAGNTSVATGAGVTVSNGVAPSGLVAAYGFDEGSGASASDASGTGNTGTINGATWVTTGKFGKALSFNGASSRVTIADAPSLDLSTGMTLEAWVNPTALSGWSSVMMKETGSDLAYGLYGHDGSEPTASINVGSSPQHASGTAPLALNTWTHLAGTYEGTTLRLFVNGAQAGTLAVSGPLVSSTGPLSLGGNAVWGEYFSGLIDEVRVYNRALTAAEIQADMSRAVGGASADTTPPALSAVAASAITASGATIAWTTDEASDSQVEYGPTTAYGSTTPLNGSLVTAHSVPLSGLTDTTLYHYRVKSRDSAGNLATSGDATFMTKDGTAPTVSMTAPASGATVSGTVTVTATASDNVGVTSVQFKLDGGNVGAADTTAPYSLAWDTLSATNGAHTLTAVARDAAGNTRTSAPLGVTVGNDTTAPVISGVAAGSITTSAATITWTTNEASDSQVEYGPTTTYGTTTALNGSMVTAHGVTVSGLTEATLYHFRVRSRDAAGNLATSADNSFTTRDATAPAVSITAPATGAVLSQTVTVAASASDNLAVAGVQFKLDAASLGVETTTAPYSIAWDTRGASNGTHTLTAVARDAAGNTATSSAVTVIVLNALASPLLPPDGTPPSVSIVAPVNGAPLAGTVSIEAAATDDVGVAGITFSVDGSQLGADLTAAPYAIAWDTTSVSDGAHIVTAVARDAAGNVAAPAAVSVTVANGSLRLAPEDTYLNVDAVNYSSAPTLTAYTWPDYQAANAIVLKFDLSALPAGALIHDATLNLALVGSDAGVEPTYMVSAHKILGRHPVLTGATGYTSDGATAWTPNACCYNGTPLAQADISPAYDTRAVDKTGGYKTWDVTPILQDWLVAPASNAGILLKPDTSAVRDRYRSFASMEYADPHLRPFLHITFSRPPGSDTVPPSVSLTAPAAGATVGKIVSISAAASDNVGVAGVRFQLDGVPLGAERTAPPFTLAWDTSTVADGPHTLVAVARDAAGLTASSLVTVTVENGIALLAPEDTTLGLDATNYSADPRLSTYTWPDNQAANAIVMKFDLSALPAGAVVEEATIYLALVESDGAAEASYTVSAHKVVGDNPLIALATGYTADGLTAWTPSACCYNNVPLAQANISLPYDARAIDTTPGYKAWTITRMVQEWLDQPGTNAGLLLNADVSAPRDRYRYFASSDNPDARLRPFLRVRYRRP